MLSFDGAHAKRPPPPAAIAALRARAVHQFTHEQAVGRRSLCPRARACAPS